MDKIDKIAFGFILIVIGWILGMVQSALAGVI